VTNEPRPSASARRSLTVAARRASCSPRTATYNKEGRFPIPHQAGGYVPPTTNRDSRGAIVSRKKKKKKPPRQVIPFVPRPAGQEAIGDFGVGVPVRVKAGVRDPDFPELDLGGWTGTVLEVDRESAPANCHLIWSDETYERIDPAFVDRCEAEGLDFDSIWLAETDLELDTSRPPEPATGRRPAGLDEQEARIRSALS
jgi:hypothetical protein